MSRVRILAVTLLAAATCHAQEPDPAPGPTAAPSPTPDYYVQEATTADVVNAQRDNLRAQWRTQELLLWVCGLLLCRIFFACWKR